METLSRARLELISHFQCSVSDVIDDSRQGGTEVHVRFREGEIVGVSFDCIEHLGNGLANIVHTGYHRAGSMPTAIVVVSKHYCRRDPDADRDRFSATLEAEFKAGAMDISEVLMGRLFKPGEPIIRCIQPFRHTPVDGWELGDMEFHDESRDKGFWSDLTWDILTSKVRECS